MSSSASAAAVDANLRAKVASDLHLLDNLIEVHAYRAARILCAHLHKRELTYNEQQWIDDSIGRLPDAEQPMRTTRMYTVRAIEEAFDVNIETFNKTEFIAFARGILLGAREDPTDRKDQGDQTYLYRVVRESKLFAPLDMIALTIETLRTRIPRLETYDDESNDSWGDEYLIEGAIRFLSRTGSASAFEEIVGIVDYCLERGYYRVAQSIEDQICPRRFDSLMPNALRSLHEMFHEDIELGFSAQPRVQKWKQQLEDAGTDAYTRELLYKLIPFS